jgi:hypothetical protein
MKTNKLFLVAAIACATVFTSCSNEDNPNPQPANKVIGFENATLNANGFWIGEATGNSYSYDDDWGGTTTTYTDNVYQEAGVTFPVSYSVYSSEWGTGDYWSGFAISNRKETTFDPLTLTPDQYNNVTGKANSGNNFCVITTYGEKIDLGEGKDIKSLYYTNSAYTVNSILNGDNYAGAKFGADDWFKCTLTAETIGGETKTIDIMLAEGTSYVNKWTKLDLSSFGRIKSLSFGFTGSRSNEYGVLTPAYICIDDVEIQ